MLTHRPAVSYKKHTSDVALRTRMEEFQSDLERLVLEKDAALRSSLEG